MICSLSLRFVFVVGISVICVEALADAPVATSAATTQIAIAVHGENGKAQSFDFAALDKLPQHEVHAQAHGNQVVCSGPNLIDVLAQVGAPTGDALRGKNLALYVRLSAADGYRVVYALAELDPGFRSDVPILTHQCNGKPLDAKDGPFRIVAPGEKRPARWIRQVTAIDLLRAHY